MKGKRIETPKTIEEPITQESTKKEKTDSTEEKLEPREILKLVKKHEASGVDSGEVDRATGIDAEMQLTEPMIKILESITILDGGLWEFKPEQIDVIEANIDMLRNDIKKIKEKDKDEKSCAEAFVNFFDNPDQISKARKKIEVLAD
ncbi:MAG: hypothetical protein NT058_01065 [Candidatus Portnoybacteria bacterium]|nr:hypothetical protein [Candidatus Portnoybacteria bacterium]